MTEVTAIFNFSILISATTDDKPFSHPPATENMTLNLNDDSFIQQLDFYLSGIILLLVCLLGLICNLLVVVVLTHRSMRSSTNSFLLSLAIFDSMVLLCTTFLICFPPLSSTYTKLIFPHIVAYIYPLALLAQTCTIWITVSFTVERYIAVTHPLKASSMCTIKRARLTTVLVVTIAVLYNACRWFEYRSVRVFITDELNNTNLVLIPNTKLPTFRVQPTMLEQNKIYETVYFSVLYLTVMCIVPILLLGTLNTFLILAVRRSQKERRNMSTSNTSKENNITIMLVSVVVVFIICQVSHVSLNWFLALNTLLHYNSYITVTLIVTIQLRDSQSLTTPV